MRSRWGALAGAAAVALLAGCGGGSPSSGGALPSVGSTVSALSVESPDLADGRVARDITCDGSGRAPTVRWAASSGAAAAVVEFLDPDAPGGTFVHWLAVATGPDATAGVLRVPAVQGRNDFGQTGYGGPCPPGGQVHRYHLTVTTYATPLTLASGFSAADLASAVAGHALLGHGELVAAYGR